MGNYRPFLQGPLPVANYTRIIIPGRFWTRPPSTKSTRMASSATPLHDSLIELAIPDAHAHAIKWYLNCYIIIYNEKYFSDDQFSYIVRVLTWRAYKRCALLQVQKTHDWSELLYRVHKRGCQGLGAIIILELERAAQAPRHSVSTGHRASSEARGDVCSLSSCGLVVDSTFERSENFAITR